MTWNALRRGEHLEPPPWLYARLARRSLMRLIYRLFGGDLVEALPRGSRLLDVGTGPGYLPGHLARVRPDLEICGLDFSYDMIRRVQPRATAPAPQARARWVVGDACLLPFQGGVFDHLLATFSFHIWPCPVAGLQELRRVLAPGGQAWVYELRREASHNDLMAFARETNLQFPLVYLGFKIVSRHHAVPAPEFAQALKQAAGARGTLRPVHHIFWRAELAG
ncbi:MAG: class I SAM-dependent methyltransferase [Desulfobaccales bacterium]